MARKVGTPTGISLEDLVQGLKNQQLDMSDDIKKILADEEERKKEEKQKKVQERAQNKKVQDTPTSSTAETPVKEEKEPESTPKPKSGNTEKPKSGNKDDKKKPDIKKKKDVGFAKSFLQNFVGKDLANKLIRKTPVSFPSSNTSSNTSSSGGSSTKNDIKEIKSDIHEIKAILVEKKPSLQTPVKQEKKPSVLDKFASMIAKMSKKPAPTRGKVWINNGQDRRLVKPDEIPSGWYRGMGKKTPKTSTVEKVQKPSLIDSKRLNRVPVQHVATEVQKLETNVQNDVRTAAKPEESVLPKPVDGVSDQQKVENTKQEVAKEAEAKIVHDKLDKILEELDKIKKKNNQDILGKLGKFGALLASAWSAIKGMSKLLGTVFKKVAQFGKILGSWMSTLAKNVGKWVTSAVRSLLPRLPAAGALAGAVGITYLEGKALDWMSNKAYQDELKPFKSLEQKYGLKAEGMGKFDLKGKQYSYEDLPDQYKKLINAYTGDTRTGSAKQAQQYIKEHESDFKALEVKSDPKDNVVPKATQVQQPTVTPLPKQAPRRLMEASVANVDMKRDVQTEPQVVVIKGGNKTTVLPSSQKNNQPVVIVRPRNPEPSLDRYNGSIFDSPSGYYSLYRM